MAKKSWIKAVALLLCFAFVSLSVPNLVSAERKAPKFDVRVLWEKPLSLFASLFSFLTVDHHRNTVIRNSSDLSGIVVPTGDISSMKTGDNK